MNKQDKRRFRQITKILKKRKIKNNLTPVNVRETIEELGPTYVKLGQIMSTREDIIPKEFCLELEKLKENVAPLEFNIVLDVIKEELKKDPNEVFLSIDEVPLGSASIGQVHKAKLIDGTDVVIKVMRPGIYDIVLQDYAVLKEAIKYLNLFTDIEETVDLKMVLDEIFDAMKLEMDFINEQSNIDLFTSNNSNIKYIKLPKTFKEYTSKHMLVMEYIDGVKIDDVEGLKKNGYDIKEVSDKFVENFIIQIIEQGVFHADPHSGNVKVHDGQIVWLDLGMIGVINKREQQLYKRAIKAIIKNDIYDLKNAMLLIGVTKHEINHAKLYQDLEGMLSKYGDMNIKDMNMGYMFEDLMNVARKNSISLPKGITLLGRSIVVMQRVVATLNPTTNILEFFSKYLKDNFKEEFDIKSHIPGIAQKVYKSSSKMVEIPSQIGDLLDITIKGQRHLNVEVVNLRENVNKTSRMANRIILGIIISSLIFSIGLILASLIFKSDQLWVSILSIVLAALGVLLVIILVIFLIILILKEKKK